MFYFLFSSKTVNTNRISTAIIVFGANFCKTENFINLLCNLSTQIKIYVLKPAFVFEARRKETIDYNLEINQ